MLFFKKIRTQNDDDPAIKKAQKEAQEAIQKTYVSSRSIAPPELVDRISHSSEMVATAREQAKGQITKKEEPEFFPQYPEAKGALKTLQERLTNLFKQNIVVPIEKLNEQIKEIQMDTEIELMKVFKGNTENVSRIRHILSHSPLIQKQAQASANALVEKEALIDKWSLLQSELQPLELNPASVDLVKVDALLHEITTVIQKKDLGEYAKREKFTVKTYISRTLGLFDVFKENQIQIPKNIQTKLDLLRELEKIEKSK